MNYGRRIDIWVLAPALGVATVWIVSYIGVYVAGIIEANTEDLVFFEATVILPLFYGSLSGPIVAGLGAVFANSTKAAVVAFGLNAAFFPFIAWNYQRWVAQYSPHSVAVFWYILIVGLIGGTAAGAVGGAWGHFRATSRRNTESGSA